MTKAFLNASEWPKQGKGLLPNILVAFHAEIGKRKTFQVCKNSNGVRWASEFMRHEKSEQAGEARPFFAALVIVVTARFYIFEKYTEQGKRASTPTSANILYHRSEEIDRAARLPP